MSAIVVIGFGACFVFASAGAGYEAKQNRHLNLSHHHLRVYRQARKLAQLVHAKPISNANLRKHASEASVSVGLNIGEGAGQEGGAPSVTTRSPRAA